MVQFSERNKRVGAIAKEHRQSKFTQMELGIEVNMSRTGYADLEAGKALMSPDIGKAYMQFIASPVAAVDMSQAFTGTGPIKLDGEYADMHRSSVKEKTLEELREVTEKLQNYCFSKPFRNQNPYEVDAVKDIVMESIEAITALTNLTAVISSEAGISYFEAWQEHYGDLQAKKYITKDRYRRLEVN